MLKVSKSTAADIVKLPTVSVASPIGNANLRLQVGLPRESLFENLKERRFAGCAGVFF
jgi:hypothetical protein